MDRIGMVSDGVGFIQYGLLNVFLEGSVKKEKYTILPSKQHPPPHNGQNLMSSWSFTFVDNLLTYFFEVKIRFTIIK